MGRKTLDRREPVAHPRRRGPAKHAISGLLPCGTCGGSFCCVNGREPFGCSWHRDRGAEVCASSLRIPRRALEARMFGGLRELLSPGRVGRVVGLALAEFEREAAQDPAAPLRARLAAVEREIGNVVDLAATHGASEAVRRKLDKLEAERAGLAAEGGAARRPPGAPRGGRSCRGSGRAARVPRRRAALRLTGPRTGLPRRRRAGAPVGQKGKSRAKPRRISRGSRVVAGAGFEPATCGL